MADVSRRRFLQASMLASGAVLLPGVMQAAWAAGSDKPEQETVRIGFIPLTDCAPVVIAALKGFDKKYGITIVPTKEASWAAVRDKLVAGALAAAVAAHAGPLVIVTNEVGWGVVPMAAVSRLFADEQGRLNQRVAAVCDRVTLVAAGLPLTLK